MKRFNGVILGLVMLVVVGMAGSLGPVLAQGGPDAEGNLLRMLAYVPDTPDNRQWVTYGDVATWHTAWDVPRVDNLDAVQALDNPARTAWLYTQSIQTTPPQALGLQYLLREADGQRATFGFNFFDLDRGLEAGQPPDVLAELVLDVDPAQIETALIASGYTAVPLGTDGTLYQIHDDYELDMTASLHGAQLGYLNRIGLINGVTLIGRATAIVEGAVQAASGELPSLAADPAYRAAAEVVESDPALEETGPLLGVILLPPETVAAGDVQFKQPGTLPPFALAAFATRHTLPGEGPLPGGQGATSLVLALVLDPGADAESAAQTLAERLDGYVSQTTGAPLSDRWTLAQSFGTEAEGLPIAVAVMRVDDPLPEDYDVPGMNGVFGWIDLVVRRDMLFLATE